ncbi:MAG: UDP-N-acetylmuramoyl-L-alanyl-D-glutamate--2,6-diaminopimelate ligase [Coriobacteriia bacterium]|nr:UDP-N-acetylmuramoyl-L-alanyl-D-glutamate--2,6-diaminopimelate ligase [Coriobacteriia bacterium]
MDTFDYSERIALARAAEEAVGDPSRDMRVMGVTGTNGKTTTTHLFAEIMNYAQRSTFVIGTIGGDYTTPPEPELAETLARARDEDYEAVALEVSSHALVQHRVAAVHFAVTAFSNLTQDHLDYHESMESYFAAKKKLFLDYESAASVVNIDTTHGRRLVEEIRRAWPERTVLTVSSHGSHSSHGSYEEADPSERPNLYATDIEGGASGATFTLHIHSDTSNEQHEVKLPLVAAHNIDNALLAAGCAYALGIAPADIVAALSGAAQIPGRLQRVTRTDLDDSAHATDSPTDSTTDPLVFVDYAHTPDALESALKALRPLTEGRIIVVMGCGGDRDRTKRPLMGEIAACEADMVIVTSDNPRSEDSDAIIDEIVAGMYHVAPAHYGCETDRAEAILWAIEEAHPEDIVLIAGKGHETYQIIGDTKADFDDVEQARAALTIRAQQAEVEQ